MSSLPTFGGEDVRDTLGVWSWDATRKLVDLTTSKTTIDARCSCGIDFGQFSERQPARDAATAHAVAVLGGAQ